MSKLLAIQFTNITTPGGYQPGSGIEGSTSAIEKLISNVLVVLTLVGGIAFILYFLLGGLNWITAGGDKGKIEEARSKITNGIIGLSIVASAWAIYLLLDYFFGIGIAG